MSKEQLIAADFDSLYEWVENEFSSYAEAHDAICKIFGVDPEEMAREMGCKDAYGIHGYLVDKEIG
jgi:hypothetical protein